LERNLTSLAASGHDLVLLQVLDPAELNFDFDRAVMFRDVESGRDLFIDPATARKEYLRRLHEHNDAVRGAAQRLGASCRTFSTDRPLELAMFDFLRERMQRGRATSRFSGTRKRV
jgi:uncharacterized protein (DUF58 family)